MILPSVKWLPTRRSGYDYSFGEMIAYSPYRRYTTRRTFSNSLFEPFTIIPSEWLPTPLRRDNCPHEG